MSSPLPESTDYELQLIEESWSGKYIHSYNRKPGKSEIINFTNEDFNHYHLRYEESFGGYLIKIFSASYQPIQNINLLRKSRFNSDIDNNLELRIYFTELENFNYKERINNNILPFVFHYQKTLDNDEISKQLIIKKLSTVFHETYHYHSYLNDSKKSNQEEERDANIYALCILSAYMRDYTFDWRGVNQTALNRLKVGEKSEMIKESIEGKILFFKMLSQNFPNEYLVFNNNSFDTKIIDICSKVSI